MLNTQQEAASHLLACGLTTVRRRPSNTMMRNAAYTPNEHGTIVPTTDFEEHSRPHQITRENLQNLFTELQSIANNMNQNSNNISPENIQSLNVLKAFLKVPAHRGLQTLNFFVPFLVTGVATAASAQRLNQITQMGASREEILSLACVVGAAAQLLFSAHGALLHNDVEYYNYLIQEAADKLR